MNKLSYEARKKMIGEWLIGFLARYEVPNSFDTRRAKEEMVFMVEDINSEIPNGFTDDRIAALLERIAVYVRKNTTTRTWPTIRTMLKGLSENLQRMTAGEAPVGGRLGENVLDPAQTNARRIRAGEAVGDYWVWGKGADLLVNMKLVTQEQIDAYSPPKAKGREPLTAEYDF